MQTISTLFSRIHLAILAVMIMAAPQIHGQDLDQLSFEQLLSVEVTSASRKAQNLTDVAAAIFVITAEDIRRSGVNTIPDALRMAPGIHVGRIDDTRWAVTSRGFNDQYSNKLLVLMDGRHIYTPYFAGVFWDQQLISVDDIERIEVIRGPGATLWGSNAVNGVINIISRSARDTQGAYLQGRVGSQDSHSASLRYGSVTDNGWFYRLGFDAIEENLTDSPLDAGNGDFWSHHKIGARIEGSPLPGIQMQLEGAHFNGGSMEVVQSVEEIDDNVFNFVRTSELDTSGGWLMLNLSNESESGEGWSFHTYYDSAKRESLFFELEQNAFSMDFQSRHYLGDSHDVIWGLGARFLELPVMPRNRTYELIDPDEDWDLLEFFIQDEISLSDNLSLVLGSKFEDSEYVDWQVQPNVRLNWRYSDKLSLWGAVSKAARTPSYGERQLRIAVNSLSPTGAPMENAAIPLTVSIVGDDSYGSEWLTAYEAGIRGQLSEAVAFDLTLFKFDYDDVRGVSIQDLVCKPSNVSSSVDPTCFATANYFDTVLGFTNDVEADTAGAELALQWRFSDSWNLDAALSLFNFDLQEVPVATANAYSEPEWLAHVRSQWSLANNVEIDLAVRGTDSSNTYGLDKYVTADLRVGWKPGPDLTLELIGQNLIDEDIREYGSYSLEVLPSTIGSRVMLGITWAP